MVFRGLAIIECSHMQKDKPGKKTDLSEQRLLAGIQDKKRRIYGIWVKGQPNQDYQDFMRLCRKKIRRAKIQLEYNLATVIEDTKGFCGRLGSVRLRLDSMILKSFLNRNYSIVLNKI